MLAGARVVLKRHRAELGLATLLALSVAVTAPVLAATQMERSGVAEQLLRIMGVLPLGLGLVVGIPIVSRELESGTAQLAWSLDGSRIRWLMRQTLAVLPVLLIASALAAFGTSALVARFEAYAEPEFFRIGSYGLPAVARTFAAFGLGLLLGVLVGRALPALVVGVIASWIVLSLVMSARDAWLSEQGPLLPMEGEAHVIQTDWAMLAPDGSQLTLEEAVSRVPEGVGDPDAWLEEQGYTWYGLGIAKDVAMGWEWYDASIFLLLGLVAAGGAVWAVNERRPI